jgi:leader peptidase (prepilin peptidase) / N-methyltransferase
MTLPFPLHLFVSILSFLWGACAGSFLNVCIYRIPRDMSVVRPRSHCPGCGKMIPWYLNIPLVSFLFLRGKCAFCGVRISARDFLVELLTGVLFLLVWLKFDLEGAYRPLGLIAMTDWRLVPVYWLMVGGLILGTFVDFEHLIIPDRVTLGGIVAGLVLSGLFPSLHGVATVKESLLRACVGAAVGWGFLWGVGALGTLIFRKPAMGFGDVKLLGAMGAFLGWQAVFFIVVVSSFFGSLVGVTLVLSGQRTMQGRIPYGPYLALAAVLWSFWGQAWWNAYFSMFARLL